MIDFVRFRSDNVRDKTVGAIGEAATHVVSAEIVANIQKRLGKQFGGNPDA